MSGALHFADRLIERSRALGNPLCVGLDPMIDRIPKRFASGDPSSTVGAFLEAVLDRAAGKVAVVKPQIAFFEQLGSRGIEALERIVAAARARDLLVLLDAKRGDIGSTADAYARAYLDPDGALPCDAITINPYLGRDTLEPFIDRAERHGRGVFVLVKTSNPGSGDYQDRLAGGEPLFAAVARSLSADAERLRGKSGWSSLGAVVGATRPDDAPKVRELLPHSPFLVPGYGAQGASASDSLRGFVAGPEGPEGGIVNSSRAILYPREAETASDAHAWEAAIDRAIGAAIDDLRGAAARR